MSTFSMAGLRPEQGPPLVVPLSFFVAGPLFAAAAGGLLVFTGGVDSASIFSGFTLALVHLTTIGFLLMVMTGALYQMLPVVGGAVVPRPRLGHGVQALLALGLLALVGGLLDGGESYFLAAFGCLTAATTLFLVPAAIAVVKSPARGPTPVGLRLALLGLLAVASLGLRLAFARGTTGYTDDWMIWRHVHAHLGLVTWVGVLIASVSWQVVPMFYLAAEPPRSFQWTILGGTTLTLLALAGMFLFDLPEGLLAYLVAPGALAVWVLEPVLIVRAISRRKRRRPDPSLWFWYLSMGLAPVALALDVGALLSDAPAFPPLFGFVALWGWAGGLVHGMLTRIVPFLVWMHRCSRWVGFRPVPSTRELYPDRWVKVGFGLHAAALGAGTAAITLDEGWIWRVFGACLVATMLLVAARALAALRLAPSAEEAAEAPVVGG